MAGDAREADLLATLRRDGPLSRWELHQRLRLRANTVGELAAGLIEQGMVREGEAAANGRGRPRVPLEIDPRRRWVLGVAMEPGRVGVERLNLLGDRPDTAPPPSAAHNSPATGQALVDEAARVLAEATDDLAAVGVSVPGFIDLDRRMLLLSSIAPDRRPISLEPLYDAVERLGVPLVIENDMHALAAQWSLTRQADARDDMVLVSIRDGAVGAAVLIDGRPNRGCVGGGNELGHHRFCVDTELCYCGRRGCLERICSSAFLQRGGDRRTLAQAAEAFAPGDAGLGEIIDHLATGLANAVNFIRPNRLVVASPLLGSSPLSEALVRRTRSGLLSVLAERVRIDLWKRPGPDFAQAAGWLALTSIYRTGWGAD